MNIRNLLLAALLTTITASFTACTSTGADESGSKTETEVSPSPSGSWANPETLPTGKFTASLAKWKQSELKDYSFRIERECYCFPMGWMDVTVSGGLVTKVDSVPGQPFLYEPEQFKQTPTVEALFGTIERNLERMGVEMSVEYDKANGFPLRILIVNDSLRDADYSITVSNLKAL